MQETLASVARAGSTDELVKTLHIEKETAIEAPPDIVWESILEEMGPHGTSGDGKPMPMKLEPWPGGRWFRDLGDNAGHFWGHVQVIKPPKLLEVCGPLFMSYPAMSHVQYRLVPQGDDATLLKLTHRAIGMIDPEHSRGVHDGWNEILTAIRKFAARRVTERAAGGAKR